MKTKLFIFSFIVLAVSTLSAKVLTVCNAPITGGHFTNLQTAIDSATPGDTVYVVGSPNPYSSYGDGTGNNSNIYITNQITLIGAGYAVTGTQNNWSSYINGSIYIDSNGYTIQLSGTKILGMDVNGALYQTGFTSKPINNIDIERSYFNSWLYVYGYGWSIINNDLYGVQVQNWNNLNIQNNFLYTVQNSNQSTVVISNNDFVIDGGNAFSSVSNALIANNVFFYDNPATSTTSCVYSNNISFNGSPITLPPAGNTGAGNINPASLGVLGFTDAALSNYVGQNIWAYTWTFKATSPAHNGGTDGTDIGATGGAYPMPNYTGATRIPQMQLMNVPAIVPSGGSMNVNFKARIQN
jgi:hypothetical protein